MTLNELLEAGSITCEEGREGFTTIKGTFAISDSGVTDRELQDSAERSLRNLLDDFRQYLAGEAFSDDISVYHIRQSGGLYWVDAFNRAVEGGLKYAVSVDYGFREERGIPIFEIRARKEHLPPKVTDTVNFPGQAQQRCNTLQAHNSTLAAYGARLMARQ